MTPSTLPIRAVEPIQSASLDDVLGQLNTAMCVLDAEMCYVACTPRWREQQELGGVAVIGKNIYRVPHRFAFATFCPGYFSRALKGESFGNIVERFETAGGKIEWISWSVSPYRPNSGGFIGGILVAVEVITRIRELEQQLTDERERSHSNARLAALGEMSGAIAHELNNPMAIMYGLVDELRETLPQQVVEDEGVAELIDSLDQTIDRVVTIVKGLRNIARDGSKDDFERADLDDIVEETLALCKNKLKYSGIEIRVKRSAEPQLVSCQRVQVAQVLLNLLNNAFDAVTEADAGTDAGATVDDGAGVAGSGHRWVEVAVGVRGDGAAISVSDSGPGVPVALRDAIMKPFFTTKARGKGTGLGLTISQRIMRSHGGELLLAADAAKATFVMSFPAHAAGSCVADPDADDS